jgi:hypothetical protein
LLGIARGASRPEVPFGRDARHVIAVVRHRDYGWRDSVISERLPGWRLWGACNRRPIVIGSGPRGRLPRPLGRLVGDDKQDLVDGVAKAIAPKHDPFGTNADDVPAARREYLPACSRRTRPTGPGALSPHRGQP